MNFFQLHLDDDSDGSHIIFISNRVIDRKSERKRTITKCCLAVFRYIEKSHGV